MTYLLGSPIILPLLLGLSLETSSPFVLKSQCGPLWLCLEL